MSNNRSVFTEAVLRSIENAQHLKEMGESMGFAPFMREEVSARDEATRVMNMNPAERRAWVKEVGNDRMVEVMGRIAKRGQANAK